MTAKKDNEQDDHDPIDVQIGIQTYIRELDGITHTINFGELAGTLGVSVEMTKDQFGSAVAEMGYAIEKQGRTLAVIAKKRRRPSMRTIRVV